VNTVCGCLAMIMAQIFEDYVAHRCMMYCSTQAMSIVVE
jgi:hypothetical protein